MRKDGKNEIERNKETRNKELKKQEG